MNIIDKSHLLTSYQVQLLRDSANLPFNFGGFRSLDDILTRLGVDVIIEPGIKERSAHPLDRKSLLDRIKKFWEKESNRLEREIHDEESKKAYREVRAKIERIWIERDFLTMKLRGYYDPDTNSITLFPEEMETEYQGMCMDELLVSTLAHETMHAYFNRPNHEYPYVYFVEEPLAEFGMLLYLHETKSSFYNWAHNDVSGKRTCYSFGATLMDQFMKESHPSPTRAYLEAYKIGLGVETILLPINGIIDLPSNTSVYVNGRIIQPKWKNIVNLPTYFWDDRTQTLGLNGDWIDDLFGGPAFHLIVHELDRHGIGYRVKNLYLGDCFRTDGSVSLTHFFDLENASITIDSTNPYCKMDNGFAKSMDGSLLPIYESCGSGFYSILQNGKWGIFDESSDSFITPCKYDCIWSFDDNGLCQVRIDKEYGYVNKDGKEQIPVVYDHLYNFENGVTTAKKNGYYGIIDENNNIVHPFDMDYPDMRAIRNGYATMKGYNGKWGAIDAKGNVVIPCQYDSLVDFNKKGIAEVKKDGEEFLIDTKGNRV